MSHPTAAKHTPFQGRTFQRVGYRRVIQWSRRYRSHFCLISYFCSAFELSASGLLILSPIMQLGTFLWKQKNDGTVTFEAHGELQKLLYLNPKQEQIHILSNIFKASDRFLLWGFPGGTNRSVWSRWERTSCDRRAWTSRSSSLFTVGKLRRRGLQCGDGVCKVIVNSRMFRFQKGAKLLILEYCELIWWTKSFQMWDGKICLTTRATVVYCNSSTVRISSELLDVLLQLLLIVRRKWDRKSDNFLFSTWRMVNSNS